MSRDAAAHGEPTEADLKRWVQAWLRRRDEAAARALIDALYPTVMAIIRARRIAAAAEQDVAQEVLVKFFEKLGAWSERAPLRHWVARIATNQCLDYLRAESRKKEWRLADLTEEEAQALEHSLVSPERLADLQTGTVELAQKLLARLTPEERVVIEMLDMEGRTATEVQQLTGWSSVAIRVRAFRARRKLRQWMQRLGSRL
ncbi:MAG: RNA polymerase sigma factor [Verrucomicrobiae bacterium]|nr:RNA polymerase sigma factor [Verrucomicrobiae bacterium]